MAAARFTPFASSIVPLPVDDIDTDQIIPARFLKGTDTLDLGRRLFADWRYRPDGAPNPGFPLNRPQAQGAQILLAGRNFGCGSSREHAAWALAGWGFRAVVALSFGDIFRANALKNGLLPVQVEAEAHRALLEVVRREPASRFGLDLATQTLALPGGRALSFPIDGFSRRCLLEGVDELGYLLAFDERIAAHEAAHDPD